MTIALAGQGRARWIAAIAAFAACAIAGAARAQTAGDIVPYQPPVVPLPGAYALPPMMLPPPSPPPVKRWYGYQIMLTDLGSILLLTNSGQYLGTISYLAVPAVIHGLHHNRSMAIASPLLRLGLPLAGMLIGVSAENCPHNTSSDDGESCGLGGAILGLGIGLLTAMILDYSLASYEDVPTYGAVPPTARRPLSGVTLAGAGVAPTANGATLVLGGAF
jgi:hypothetical protein